MLFNEERKPMNLGGTSTSVSREQALMEARLQRLNRENDRKRNQAAIRLQAWWRRIRALRSTQTWCRRLFDKDPSTLLALRSLILLHDDVARMNLWSTTMINDNGLLLKRLTSDERSSWLILIRQLSKRLLKFMADRPSSPVISTHLRLMHLWLNPTNIPGIGADLCDNERSNAISYMLRTGYYESLCKVIESAHNSFASLPLLVPLLTFPLRILRGSLDRNSYMEALLHFSLYILPIPQLASVITKPLSKQFAVDIGLFLEDLAFLTPLFPRIESQITLHFSIHSLSNLMLFTPPRYSQLSVSCYDAYLRLLSMLLNHLPEVILQGSNRGSSWTNFCAGTKAHVIGVPPGLDSKTQNRLDRVLSSDHICKLLTAADCPSKLLSLATYLPQFCLSWLSQVDNVLHAVATSDATRFARLLYVEKVADMSLGKTYIENPVKLIGSATFEHWARLLFFTDLFMLLNPRMNDQDFYLTTSESRCESNIRNPLEADQLQTFLMQLCTIVYVLDRLPALRTDAPAARGKIDWKQLNARLKDSLLIFYCREVRRPRPLPEIPGFRRDQIECDLDDNEAQWTKKANEKFDSWKESCRGDKSPRDKILESDPSGFNEILAQQNSEDNVRLFRYFPWSKRMLPEVVFPHRLGDFYLMRFERTEDEFNPPDFPNFQDHRKWMRDPCNQIFRCYEAALDIAPPDYPAKVDLLQKLAFMLLWRFEVDLELDDFCRAFVYLQNALDLDASFSSLERTVQIGRWFFGAFAHIARMINVHDRNASRLGRPVRTMLPSLYSGGNRTRSVDYDELARNVVRPRDHPVLSLVISAIKQNVETLTPDSLETLAAWHLQCYQCQKRAEDLDDGIAMQTRALTQRIEARNKERDGEESDDEIEWHHREVEDESEGEEGNDRIVERVTNEIEVNVAVPKAKKQPPQTKHSALDEVAVVACGQQLAVWLQLRYELLPSKEDLETLRELLVDMVMSYTDPTGMFECAFLFSRLPPPLQLPYGLYDRAIVGLHSLATSSLVIGSLDLMLRLHDSTAFISDIVAMALQDNNLVKALEWLENSRCLIWNRVSSLWESPVRLDFERRGLGQNIISFHTMEAIYQRASKGTYVDGNRVLDHLTDGPIILLNASTLGCDAMILRPNVGPQRLPLATLSLERVSAWHKTFIHLLHGLGALVRGDERKARPFKPPQHDGEDDFQKLLEEIWVGLVEPLLNFVFGSKNDMQVSEKNSLPRIWWCCSGPFSFLPIHAAGLYTSYGPQVRLSDFTVSSYIPSLSSAISCPPTEPPADFKLLVIAQPLTPHFPPLPGTIEEVSNIKKQAKSLQTVVLSGEEATRAAVRREAPSAAWIHIACHGQQKGTHSSLELHDGSLNLQRLSLLPGLSQAEFAFLSACETATGDSDLPGEALHIACGLHRLGYRSVIATMFSIRDQDAPFVGDKVYEQLFEDERPNYRKAAQALHRAIHLLQDANGRRNFRTWVPFIHIGM